MQRNFSIYLDVIRFTAAVAVFLEHLGSFPFTKNIFPHSLTVYGSVAVVIFFILSGYVIGYVTDSREKTAHEYAIARISRLYSVVLIAIIITFTLDFFGSLANPEFYEIKKVWWKPPSVEGYLATSLFVNEYAIFNFGGISAGSNAPFWSLSFEATYYAVAGLMLFSKKAIWIPLSLIVFLLAGKTIAALSPLWFAGFFLYKAQLNARINFWLLSGIFFTSIIAIFAVPTVSAHLPSDNFGHLFPWGRGLFNRNLIEDYLAGIFFIIHLISAKFLCLHVSDISKSLEDFIRALGAMTFPMYLLHYPILCFLVAISPWSNTSMANALMISLVAIITIAILSPLCDKLKVKIKSSLKTIYALTKN